MGIAVDGSGVAYVTGQTASDASVTPFPTTSSAYQASLANPNGNAFLTVISTNQYELSSLVYSTYLGGNSTGFGDYGMGIAVDGSGDAFITGETTSGGSTPFPTTSNAYQTTLNSVYGNVFITEIATELSGSQSLVYSTYMGGSSNVIIGDSGSGIALDASGKVYVDGDTTSADFPVTSGAFQTTNSAGGRAFVAKFDLTQSGAQSLIYSTYLGGTNGSEGEVANGIAVDANGEAFASGSTSSSDFPTTSDAYQTAVKNDLWNVYLTQVNSTGTGLLYSTYLGGSCSTGYGDLGFGVALDSLGDPYIDGSTCSSDFPVYPSNAYQPALAGAYNAFVAKFDLTSLVSISVNPQSPSLAVNASQQFSAIGTLSDGSTEDLTTSATWSSSNTSIISESNSSPTQGFAVAISTGTANITALYGSVSGSATVTVTAAAPSNAPPTIASVSPTMGGTGTQVTITGSGFGSVQGSGYLTLGTVFGQIVSWSDSQIIATVAPGSQSGVAQVQQGGLQSNSVTFTVCAPTITSISPTSGVAGTSVTISGTGFGSSQGSGQVQLGSVSGTVTSWSNTQIVATVATGSTSGTVQVLQNGVWSNAVSFGICVPQITNVSPDSGSSGTAVTISGTGFGASQGSGQVWLGSTNGIIDNWSDTQITATVASNSLTGIVRVEQSGTWSNAFAFTVPTTGGSSLMLSPNTINMVVGATHSIQALNAQGQSVTGLTWASSDTTVVTLSTDDPPILTAVAVGHVTITAGSASADVTVSASLSPGTVQWSNPGDGSGVTNIVPAVPGPDGLDVFAFESSGNVAAINTDGTIAWTANLNGGYGIPTFDGGLLLVSGNQLQELNGATGQPYSAYTFSNSAPSSSLIAEGSDGTVYAVDGNQLVAIDPTTGSVKFSASMETTSYTYGPACEGGYNHSVNPASPSQLLVAGDGNAYLVYSYSNSMQNPEIITNCNYGVGHQDVHLRVLRMSPEGSIAEIAIQDWTENWSDYQGTPLTSSQTGPEVAGVSVNGMLTNGSTGVVLSWTLTTLPYCAFTETDYVNNIYINAGCVGYTTTSYFTNVSSSGVGTTAVPYTIQPVLQRSDGTFVGYANGNMAAFGLSGNVEWSNSNYSPLNVTADGGTTAISQDGLTIATFDGNGNATGQNPSLSGTTPDWAGNTSYTIGQDGSVVSSVFMPIAYDASYAAMVGNNQTLNGTAIEQVQTNQTQGTNEQLPPNGATLNTNYNSIELLTTVTPAQIFNQYIQSFAGAQTGNNTIATVPANTNITASGQTLTFTLYGLISLGQGPFKVQIERFDSSADTISAVTLVGHPLEGWRYWKVFSIGTNDIVIETGGADLPGPGRKNYWGYFFFSFDQTEVWHQYLEYIKGKVGAPQGSNFQYNLVEGEWGYRSQSYILNNVCQSSWCN